MRIEYTKCPNCGRAFYREIKTDFRGKTTNTTIKTGNEADFLIKKAYLNRLSYFSTKQGAKSNQNWYYGDFKRLAEKDEKGNSLEVQIKRNFNGDEVANLGVSKVIYI